MKGYLITQDKIQELISSKYNEDSYFNPILGVDGDYYISQQEINECTNPDLQWIKDLISTDFEIPIQIQPH